MAKHSSPTLDYIRKLYAPQDALLAEIAQRLEEIDTAIQIGPEEGRFLQILIALHGVRNVVEIGTLAGYSAIWMARALPDGGHLYTLNKDKGHIALARDFIARSDVAARITMIEGDARATLPTLSGKGPFDMLFIDADKIGYPDYLDWAETNVHAGGLIVADNTLLFGAMALGAPPEGTAPGAWHAMRRFNERLADRTKYLATIVPTQEGLSVAIKL